MQSLKEISFEKAVELYSLGLPVARDFRALSGAYGFDPVLHTISRALSGGFCATKPSAGWLEDKEVKYFAVVDSEESEADG